MNGHFLESIHQNVPRCSVQFLSLTDKWLETDNTRKKQKQQTYQQMHFVVSKMTNGVLSRDTKAVHIKGN